MKKSRPDASSRFVKASFFATCHTPEATEERFVSLYEHTSEYGGPEEGGWWRHSTVLVSTQKCANQFAAEHLLGRINERAKQLTDEARRRWAAHCAAETHWCEQRGLDADYLPEPDGPSEFEVVVESTAGSRSCQAPVNYE